jgi:hypothetical protein
VSSDFSDTWLVVDSSIGDGWVSDFIVLNSWMWWQLVIVLSCEWYLLLIRSRAWDLYVAIGIGMFFI